MNNIDDKTIKNTIKYDKNLRKPQNNLRIFLRVAENTLIVLKLPKQQFCCIFMPHSIYCSLYLLRVVTLSRINCVPLNAGETVHE